MADNYLESRYEAVFGAGANHKTIRQGLTYEQLLSRNVPCQEFDATYPVHIRQLQMIVSVCEKISKWFPKELFSFEFVTKGEESEKIKSSIGERASGVDAFIIVCSTERDVDIALGMILQGMTVKATEMGLGAVLLNNMDFDGRPVVSIIGIGKPATKCK